MVFLRNFILLCLIASSALAEKKAKNIILFLADAGGIPTLNAASIHGYGQPQKLFIQSWKHYGLSDTSPASGWVTDSAAGMTAIVTGVKTHNGVISMGPETVRGKSDGSRLKTILEYAEEKGLSTGVMTNVSIADATPAACYANANDRRKAGEIFLQLFHPRFGDGPDVVIGAGRKAIYDSVKSMNKDLDAAAGASGRTIYGSIDAVPAGTKRPIVVMDKGVDIPAGARLAIKTLSANKKGYFLMIEWDAHTDNPQRGLDNVVGLDKLIKEIAAMPDMKDTLLLFTADHSFDLRMIGGKPGEPLLKGVEDFKPAPAGKRDFVMKTASLEIGGHHSGEEVLVAASGPGAERVNGFMPNTHLFEIMLSAWGWKR